MKKIKFVLIFIFLLILYSYIVNVLTLPNKITVLKNQEYSIKKLWGIETVEKVNTLLDDRIFINTQVTLFGKVIKNINVEKIERQKVIPIRKNNRFEIIHKWCISCRNDGT